MSALPFTNANDVLKVLLVLLIAAFTKLIKLAANLFNGSMEVSPSELINTLDDENFELAMQAIFFRRTGCHVRDLLPAVEAVPELEQEDDEEMERY